MEHGYRGCYIACTGMDASGKSTLVKKLTDYLQTNNYKFITVREPGGCETAEVIRKAMFMNKQTPYADALMMAAARAELIQTTVIPALDDGAIVLSDRSVACSCAYQGHVSGLGVEKIWELNRDFAIHGCLPDLELFLNVDTETILKRMGKRKNINRFDEFHHDTVRDGYMKFYDLNNYRHEAIMTTGTPKDTFDEALAYLESELKRKNIVPRK